MIGRVRGIVRVAIGHIRQQAAQGVQQVAVGSGIEISRREGAGGVRDEEAAHAAFHRDFVQRQFNTIGDVHYLIFALCRDGDGFHSCCMSLYSSPMTSFSRRAKNSAMYA